MKVYAAVDGKPMDVGLLKRILTYYPDDAPIVLFSDAEGNDMKPLLNIGLAQAHVTVKNGYGEVVLTNHALGSPAVFLTPYD
jgi:hypothetical protein